MTRKEQLVNDYTTTLAQNCVIGAGTIEVNDASSLPTGDFRIVIESEIMKVTNVNGNILTVERGEEGTTAVTHNSGLTVQAVLTANQLKSLKAERDPLWTPHPNLRPLRCYDQNDAPLIASDFTGVNLGGRGTLVDSASGSLVATVDDSAPGAHGHHLWIIDTPSPPYYVYMGAYGVWRHGGSSQYPQFGIDLQDSNTSRIVGINYNMATGIGHTSRVFQWTDPTTFSSAPFSFTPVSFGPIKWFRIYDDNSNHRFSVSYDGIHWAEIYSQSRTAWLANGGDKVGFFFAAGGNTSNLLQKVVVRHFSLET